MMNVRARSRFLFLWVASALSLSIAYPQTLPDAPLPLRESTMSAHMAVLSGMHNAGNIDPSKLDQYYDANPTRRPLPNDVPTGGAAFRHRRRARPAVHVKPLSHRTLIVHVPPTPSPAYQETFRLMRSRPDATDRYDDLILKYSKMYGLDPRLVKSVMAAESEFNPGALSSTKARGLMQLMPETAEEMGVSHRQLSDPESNIRAGAAYIHALFQVGWRTFHLPGSDFQRAPLWLVQRVIAAYHAGPKFLSGTWWYQTTRAYIRRVILFYRSKITDLRRLPEYRTPGPRFATIFSPEFVRY